MRFSRRNEAESSGAMGWYLARYRSAHCAQRSSSRTTLARPSSETHSTVSSTMTAAWGLAARLRALRDRGPQLKAKQASPSSHTPHTGKAWGRLSAETVTTQKFWLVASRVAAQDHGSGSHLAVPTP
jgi:hypothetical protein